MDELEKLVARVRADGPVPLPLGGWDQASIWGWDETADSLFADLWRNTDDPAKPPKIRIALGEPTLTITCPTMLAQHVAMAVDSDPWEVLTALFEADNEDDDDGDWGDDEEDDGEAVGAGTVVTMTEGYGIWWPPNQGGRRQRPA